MANPLDDLFDTEVSTKSDNPLDDLFEDKPSIKEDIGLDTPLQTNEKKDGLISNMFGPYGRIGARAASSFNMGMANFSHNIDTVTSFIRSGILSLEPEWLKTRTEKGKKIRERIFKSTFDDDIYKKAEKTYLENSLAWDTKTEGMGLTEEIVGDFLGGAIPGIGEFILNVPYSGAVGFAEGYKKGGLKGGVKEGVARAVDRYAMGAILKASSVLKMPSRVGAMGAVGGVTAAAQGGDRREITKGVSIMSGFALTMGKGKVSFREAIEDAIGLNRLRREATKIAIEAQKAKEVKLAEVDRNFANKIHYKDAADLIIETEAQGYQENIQRLDKSLKFKFRPKPFAYEKEVKQTLSSRNLDESMSWYRDFLKTNPEKGVELRTYLNEKTTGKEKIRRKEYLRVLDRAEKLTSEQEAFVDTTMDIAYKNVENIAVSEGVIHQGLENYTRRIWDRGAKGGGSRGGKFQTFTTAQLKRTLPTIADGIMKGYDLKIKGISSQYASIAKEINTVVANKNFIKEGLSNKIFTTKQKEGYAPLKSKGFSTWMKRGEASVPVLEEASLLTTDTFGNKIYFTPPEIAKVPSAKSETGFIEKSDVFVKVPIYAPERIASHINSMTRTGSELWDTPAARSVMRVNSAIKGYILMSSLFHHFAGTVSWEFGVKKGLKINPVKAYKAGLDKIKSGNEHVLFGVKNGLTTGRVLDWSEDIMRNDKGLVESLVRSLGMERTARVFEYGKLKRENFTNSLFKKYFAGLKAEAFSVEFAHRLAEASKNGKKPNARLIAEQTGRLINADFGGLHLARMGRSPDFQNLLRLLALAPDWSESNFRTFTGMMPGANKLVGKMLKEMPPPPGMDKIYRNFWGGVFIKAGLSTAIAQIAMNGFDETAEFYSDALTNKDGINWDSLTRMKWTGVDVTKAYRALGVDVPADQKKTISLVRHFADPAKLLRPDVLLKGKSAPIIKIGDALISGSDYAGRPFTGVKELGATLKTTKKSRYQKKEEFLNRLPATISNLFLNMTPIQVGQLLRYLNGETDGLTALLTGAGLHVATMYDKPKKRKGTFK